MNSRNSQYVITCKTFKDGKTVETFLSNDPDSGYPWWSTDLHRAIFYDAMPNIIDQIKGLDYLVSGANELGVSEVLLKHRFIMTEYEFSDLVKVEARRKIQAEMSRLEKELQALS